MKIKNTKMKISVYFFIIYFVFSILSVSANSMTANQSSSLIFNSKSFELVDLTDDGFKNSFSYSYNLTSSENTNFSWKIVISRIDGYTYKFASLNGTESVIDNKSNLNTIEYNFSLSGDYLVEVYWFSESHQILSFEEYSAPNIIGLQSNESNDFSYLYWWHWQLSDVYQYSLKTFNFSIDFYFYGEYNFTFEYELKIYFFKTESDHQLIDTISGSKNMVGEGDTVQEISLSSIIFNPGEYRAEFTWKDILVYHKGDINRNIGINFYSNPDEHNKNYNNDYTYPQYEDNYIYHYELSHRPSIFSILFPFLMIGGIGFFVLIAIYKKNYFKRLPKYYRPYNNQNFVSRNNLQEKIPVASYCSNCGSHISSGGQYCFNCGTKVD